MRRPTGLRLSLLRRQTLFGLIITCDEKCNEKCYAVIPVRYVNVKTFQSKSAVYLIQCAFLGLREHCIFFTAK